MTEVEFVRGIKLKVNDHRVTMHDFTQWERANREAALQYLQRGMTAFIAGAEEGEDSALVATVVGPGNVHMFESSPWQWPNIRSVWEANFTERPGGCWAGFVADELRGIDYMMESRLSVTSWPVESLGSLFTGGAFTVHHERPEIPVITIDHYVRMTGKPPAVIMMDVEGCEDRVIAGAERVIAEHRPLLFVSVHAPDTLTYYGTSEEAILARVDRLGYRAELVSVDHERHYLFEPR